MNPFLELLRLFGVFFMIGSVTFGGGIAMLPILERELVAKRKWMTSTQMVDWFAIGQCTPGIIAVNVSTFIGYSRRGLVGAVVATAGIVAPSIIVITALAGILGQTDGLPWMRHALEGINVVVAVLLLDAVTGLGKKTLVDLPTVLVALGAFVGMAVFNVSGVFIVLASGAVGFAVRRVRAARVAKGGKEGEK